MRMQSSASFREDFENVSVFCHQTGEPVVLTEEKGARDYSLDELKTAMDNVIEKAKRECATECPKPLL